MYTTVVILLVMYVSTSTAEQSFSAMRRPGDNERLSDLALPHVQKDKTFDAELIIHQFSHLALIFGPNEGEGSN